MLKDRKGISLINIVLITAFFFVATWYASYYMGRGDKLKRDIDEFRGINQEENLDQAVEKQQKGKKKKEIAPPGTQDIPAKLEFFQRQEKRAGNSKMLFLKPLKQSTMPTRRLMSLSAATLR